MANITLPAALIRQADTDGSVSSGGNVRRINFAGTGKIVHDDSGHRFIDKHTGGAAAMPAYGDTIVGFPSDFYVDSAVDASTDDLHCTLTITLVKRIVSVIFTSPDVITEADSGSSEIPIEAHHLYRADILANQDKWNNWDRAPDSASRASAYAALSPLLKQCADKKTAGGPSVRVGAPMVRRTTRSTGSATPGVTKVRQNPPAFAHLAPAWLKDEDRVVLQGQNGTWERVELWLGAQYWDTDLYPAG